MSKTPAGLDPYIGVLRCLKCGKTINCRKAEVLDFAKLDSWPECCDEIMRLYGNDERTDEWPAAKD
jgi:hypothetical protein